MSLAQMQAAREQAENEDDGGGGFLGTGIGPDFNLGIGRLFSEIGQGVTHLASMVPDLAPGGMPAGERWSQAGKGMASSIAGTGLNIAEPFARVAAGILPGSKEGEPGWTDLSLGTPESSPLAGIREAVGEALGGEQFEPRSFQEDVGSRGLLPTLVENVGNASLVGGAVTAPIRGAAAAAKLSGNTQAAARFTATHGRMVNQPIVRAVQHPYRTAAKVVRNDVLQPAAQRVAAADGILAGAATDAPVDFLASELPDTGVDYNQVRVDFDRHMKTADAYRALPDDDPAAHAAYSAFADEVAEQYRHLTEDLGVKVEVVDEDPYPSNVDMVKDVRENRRLKIMRTSEGDHPFLTPEQNDQFRAVHDAYGHAATGRSFDRHGEEAAYLAHSSMFGDEARKAMATETRGQNSVLIKTGEFGPQKVGLLPDELVDPSEAIAKFQRQAPEPLQPGDRLLAGIELRLQGRDALRQARDQTRMAEAERALAARSPAVRTAVRTARDLVMDKSTAAGRRITRKQASIMVGDEIHARMTGIKALEQEFPAVPRDTWTRLGIRQAFIPDELWQDGALEGSLAGAVAVQLDETANIRSTLQGTRVGDTGLTGLADEAASEPALTKAQEQLVATARKKLERANSEVLARKEGRERASREQQIAFQEDKLARIAEHRQRVAETEADALEAFDHSRAGKVPAFRTPERLAESVQQVYERTMADVSKNGGWGGASFSPHSGRFVEAGNDTGFAVGLVEGSARVVPVEEFTPQHIEQVVRAHQDVFQHPNTVVGTWVEDGLVYIDPSEIVPDFADALVRGAAREQLAIFDIASVETPTGILKGRPDIASQFLNRHTNLSRRTNELLDLAKTGSLEYGDVPVAVDLLMRQAARAQDLGLVKHPDEFFSKHVAKFESAKHRSSRAGVLGQIVLERNLGRTPEERLARYREIESVVENADQVKRWYTDSHEMVERAFRGQPDVTLLDGTRANPADLFYEILAITSFQASPRDNLTRALTAFQRFDDLPRKQLKGLEKAMRRVTEGKATLEEAFGAGAGKNLAERFGGFALYPEPRKYLAEVIAGRRISTWTPEYLAEIHETMGGKTKFLDRERALLYIKEEYPELIERIGEDAAVKEFYSRSHRAKIISFWDNLRDPENSLAVTMDQQMERFFGEEMPLGQSPTGRPNDAWIRYSEQVRDMADELSTALGERVKPHQLQALLWVFAKDEINRLQMGHFNAFAADASDLVQRGVRITDDVDPIQRWIDEASEPYRTEGQRHVRDRRIVRGIYEPGDRTPQRIGGKERVITERGATVPLDQIVAQKNHMDEVLASGRKSESPGEPAFLRVRPDGKGYEIADGHHRIAEAMARGERTIKADIDLIPDDEPLRAPFYKFPKAESTEPVVYRPGWGASNREKAVGLFEKRRAEWLVVRENINASLEVGDLAGATRSLDGYLTKMRTKAPRSNGLLDDAAGANFKEIWENPEYHSKGLREAGAALDRLAAPLGEYPLLQSFRDKVLGEFVPLDDGTRGVIRVFEDGNLATLVHENGHLLRRMLPEGEMRAVEKAYRLKPGRWTVEAEERFANDLLKYMQSEKAPAGLKGAFAQVRSALQDIWSMVRGSFHRGRVHPTLKATFDSWLDPALRETPDTGPYPGLDVGAETGTIRQRAARPPRLPDPPATKRDFYHSGRKGQQALARLEQAAAKKRSLAAAEAKATKAVEEIRTVLADGRLPSQLERDTLRAEAGRIMERVDKQLLRPSVARTPARWQPVWQAVLDLEKEAKANPALADVLADLPETLAEVQRLALDNGFDPAHVRDFSHTQVRRLVFGNMRLGKRDLLHEERAGTRNRRSGTLARSGAVDRSVESFLAATVEAIGEKRTNAVIDWVETSAARTIEKGTPIPAGWVAWDPVRTYLLTGTELTADGMRQIETAATTTRIVPESVSKTLYRYSKDYDHWSLRAIRKVTSPWRTLVLTLSPGWYVRNVVGNIMLAEAEGVRLRDWKAAWQSANTKDEIGRFADIPFVTSDTLAQEAALMADESIIPRRGVREAQAESGRFRGVAQHAARKMLRVNEVVDEFARSAVYHQGLRLNMAPELAWKRASNALVDYNALSPFERQAVRSVIPFYAWQKGILKVTMNQVLDHPARTSLLMQLGQMQEEYLADRFGVDTQDIPDYYKHLVGDKNLRSFNPFADPADILSVEGIMRSFNPFLELGIRKGLGAPEFYTDQQRLGYFGSPQQDVDVFSELGEMVTRSPGGRIIGEGPGANLLGIPRSVDDEVLRSRFLKARTQVRGIPNPETESNSTALLPTRS